MAGEGTEACSLVRTFQKECPRWDLNTPNIVAELCQARGHDSCVAGTPLDPTSRRAWAEKWGRVDEARAKPEGNPSLRVACQYAQEIAAKCPAWDPNTKTIADDLCGRVAKDCAPSMDASAKKAAAPIIRPQIEAAIRTDLGLENMKDPNDAKNAVAATQSQMNLYKCYDPTSAPELEERVNKWAEQVEAAIVEEIKCRASDECRARRIANQICAAMADKAEANAMIATERRNPGGVVNLKTLHDLGEKVQYQEASIANLKRDYASLAKKPFTEALCKR